MLKAGFNELDSIWNEVLNKLEKKIRPILFQTWFKDTKLIDLSKEQAVVLVPLDVHKKHIEEQYINILKDTFKEITESKVCFKFINNEEKRL